MDNILLIDTIDKKLAKAAKKRIQQLYAEKIITVDQGDAMFALVSGSELSYAYCQYLLAPDPLAFKHALVHNQTFIRQAEEHGIDLEAYLNPLPDSGITLPISSSLESQCNPFLHDSILHTVNTLEACIAEFNAADAKLFEQTKKLYYMHPSKYELVRLPDYLFETMGRKKHNELRLKDIDTPLGELPIIDEVAVIRDEKKEFNDRTLLLYKLAKQILGHIRFQTELVSDIEADFIYDSLYKERIRKTKIHAASDLTTLVTKLESIEHQTHNLARENETNNDTYRSPANLRKIKKAEKITYFLRKEQLKPTDVLIGNSGGCCLGIYGGDLEITNMNLPFMMLDLGTSIFGIYQRLDDGPERRTGIVPAFCVSYFDETLENPSPCLPVNSVELSKMNNPVTKEILDPLVDHIFSYLGQYARSCNLSQILNGTHTHNTSRNYGNVKHEPLPKTADIIKLPDYAHPFFYQEILKQTKGGVYGGNNVALGIVKQT